MRRMLERISPVLLASVVAGGFVVASALPATADSTHERRDRLHSERPIAAQPVNEPAMDVDIAAQVAQAEAEESAKLKAWYMEAVATVAAQSYGSSSGAAVGSLRYGSCGGDVACFLECTKAHESDTSGGYNAVSGSGTYRGAYQFSQRTWDAAVAGAGYEEYAGVPADQVPASVQDAAATHLYSVSGTAAWGGRC
jgi:hypothetical protein